MRRLAATVDADRTSSLACDLVDNEPAPKTRRQERGSSGLPILDQLPGILGSAFSERNNGLVRTELIIFIRPQIIRDSVDAHFVAEELRSKLRGTAGAEAPSGPLTTKPR